MLKFLFMDKTPETKSIFSSTLDLIYSIPRGSVVWLGRFCYIESAGIERIKNIFYTSASYLFNFPVSLYTSLSSFDISAIEERDEGEEEVSKQFSSSRRPPRSSPSTNPYDGVPDYVPVDVPTATCKDQGGGVANGENSCYAASVIQALNALKDLIDFDKELKKTATEDLQKKQKVIDVYGISDLQEVERALDLLYPPIDTPEDFSTLTPENFALHTQKLLRLEKKESALAQAIKTKKYYQNNENDEDFQKRVDKQFFLRGLIRDNLKEIFAKINQNETLSAEEINQFRGLIHEYKPSMGTTSQEDAHELFFILASILELPAIQILTKIHYNISAEPADEAQRAEWKESFADREKRQEPSQGICLEIPSSKIKDPSLSLSELLLKQARKTDTALANPDPTRKKKCPPTPPNTTVIETPFLVGKPPAFLPILIKRFANPRTDSSEQKRLGVKVVPEETFEMEVLDCTEANKAKYELVSCCVQLGSTIRSGHYIAYVKKGVEGEKITVQYNDSSVGVCQDEELALKDLAHNGYLLFYRLKNTSK